MLACSLKRGLGNTYHVRSDEHPLRKFALGQILVEHRSILVGHGNVLLVGQTLGRSVCVEDDRRVVLPHVVVGLGLLVAVLALLSIQPKCFVTIRSFVWMHVVAFKATFANQFICFADHHLVKDTDARHSRLGYSLSRSTLVLICEHAFRPTVACRCPRWTVVAS